jgi:hypothetical protein
LRKIAKPLGVFLVVVLIGIQMIPNQRNSYTETNLEDFIITYDAPEEVESLLRPACYDCHSNQTNYPWYSSVQPIGLMLQNHINDGIDELNLSEFGQLSSRKRRMKIKSMVKEIEKGTMPLKSYKVLHPRLTFNEDEKMTIIDFLNSLQDVQ